MSIRYKIFSILAISQILLLTTLTLTFAVLITSVKNEPQNQRAMELARTFERELKHKDELLRLLISELVNNPNTFSILQRGLVDRNYMLSQQSNLELIMKKYNLNIFEIGNSNGIVVYRVHRPNDYGDNKYNQPIIQEALRGYINATLETGHSGLGFRIAGPLGKNGTILLGQKVDSEFAEQISGKETVHLSIFEGDHEIISSSPIIKEFMQKNYNKIKNHERIQWDGIPYYYVSLPYEDKGLSSLKLNFHILIDEKELDIVSKRIWYMFTIVAIMIFSIIFIISYLFSRDIINAVKSLNNAMKNIQLTVYDDVNLKRKDEIGQMGSAFIEMKKELYKHQHKLEELVMEKTIELQKALNDLKKIKEQQDGDYYLTSLLIKPLAASNWESNNISAEILERQKKVFTFRNRQSEIGGDFSVVQDINLKGKKYIVFLNADAMGKSIQGAGGVLVMGTVFKSVITRTKNIPAMQDRYPERWLKDTYQELQDVFVSFDGSMLLSAVLGLIDDDTGTMYYINAEHPWVVLYRDNKASFIENELLLRKIGFQNTEFNFAHFYIKVFQMRPGDIIIIGSDGRDDILYGKGDSGERIINEDEKEFLKRVEEGKGDLNGIENAILSKGELTDDFSLIRLAYKEKESLQREHEENHMEEVKNALKLYKDGKIKDSIIAFQELLQTNPTHAISLRELSKLYIKNKEFEKAIDFSEKYIHLNPHDTEFLYYIAYSYKQVRNFKLAIDYSERLRLREPKNEKNLLLLGELYIHIGNLNRAKEILNYLIELNPKNPKANRVFNFLEEKNLQKSK